MQSWMRSSSLQVQSASKHSLSQVNKDLDVTTVAPFVMPTGPQTAQLSAKSVDIVVSCRPHWAHWCFPLALKSCDCAKKRSEDIRLCVDLRRPNKAVVPDKYPLQIIEELTTLFYGSSVFTKLDLKQGYMQIPLHEDDRNLTVFVTHLACSVLRGFLLA